MVVFAISIIGKAVNIQFGEGDKWRALSDSMTTEYRSIPASRGNIYAADGALLATSVPVYDIYMDTRAEGLTRESWLKGIDSLSMALSEIFQDKPFGEYKRMLNTARKNGARYLNLKKGISYAQLKLVKQFPLFRLGKNSGGLITQEHEVRENPFGILAYRTLGLHRVQGTSVGIEAGFDDYLKGRTGTRLMQKIMGGHWMPLTDENDVEPQNGLDVYTTLDINLQDVAENALMNSLEKNKADYGCVILMETHTGDIKAIANLTRKAEGVFVEDKNYALYESTEPGSTFKLASVLALLEDGWVNDIEVVNSGDGTWKIGNAIMKDAELGGHGMLTLQKAFEHSSNVGISKFVVQKYKGREKRFADHLSKQFHLGEPLGIPIPGEGKPVIKAPGNPSWSEATLPWMSIGYEVQLTPLQMIAFYNAIANGGKLVKPRFVEKVSQLGKDIKYFPAEIISNQIAKESSIQKVKKMLEGVVLNGTGSSLKTGEYNIAGKTGTARMVVNGKYVEQYKSSFCGYFPAEDPQFTCLVIIFNPTSGVYYGASVAGPVFREISDKVFVSLIASKDKPKIDSAVSFQNKNAPQILSTDDAFRIKKYISIPEFSENENATFVNYSHGKMAPFNPSLKGGVVPNVRGMALKDAIAVIENAGYSISYEGVGKVVNQNPEPLTKCASGYKVHIQLNP